MLTLHRSREILALSAAALALGAALFANEPAWAAGCEVIDFAALKQRSVSLGGTLSTLVAAPAAAPGEFVVLEADFGCVLSDGFDPVASDNLVRVDVLKSDGGGFADSSLADSFVGFDVSVGVEPLPLNCAGPACSGLRFPMPDTGLAGPARITVTRDGSVVARIFEIGARTASCDVDVADSLVRTFTLLPPFNQLQVSLVGANNNGLQGAIAGNGSLLVPLQHDLVGEAAVDATATRATGPEIDKIPNGSFLRALSELFRPLPAIHRLVPFGSGKALYSTTDVLRSTLQVLPSSGPDIYPDNFHLLRNGAAGPVVFPTAVRVSFEGASPVAALRSSEQTVALGLSEELLGDINGDADVSDLLLAATDLPTGNSTETGEAIALVAASPARPVVAVVDDIVAFLESEALSGNDDLNGDMQPDDLVLRALKGAVQLNPGDPVDTSAHPLRAIDGSQLAISQDFVFFRTPEDATAPHMTERVSDVLGAGGNDASEQPSIDGMAGHVAYASGAGNLAPGASGAHRQILVTNLFSHVHSLVSASPGGEGNADSYDAAISAGGDHVAFTSEATNLAALGGGSGSTRVVWERGTNVQGVSVVGIALALFELAPGEEEVPGVDYSPCTASAPGLALAFADDMTITGSLFAPDGAACQFEADFSGTYSVSPAGPIQVGSIITVDAAVTSFTGVPPLDPSLSDLSFSATNIVTDVHGASFDFQGEFELGASTGVANTVPQVYVRALGGAAPVELVSAAPGGGAGSEASGQPAPSGDGQLVAFASLASDLVASDFNGAADVFVRDLANDTTERVSITNGEAEANGASSQPALTPDGNLVVFSSLASNLVGAGADTNGAGDVFLRNRSAASTERVSVPAPGGSANGASAAPDSSNDGRFVAFESAARLVPDDTDALVDIYLRDRVEGTTQRMSVRSGGEPAGDASFDPSISGDGRFVVFASLGDLVPGAPTGTKIYRRNRVTGSVELLSVGASSGDLSTSPDASGDGRTVAFDSDASLVLNDSLPVDVFVRATGFGADLNGDGDDADSVFQSFATDPPGLQPGARVAATTASTGSGRALVSVPETEEGGMNLNATSLIEGAGADGDTDTADGVLHLWDGASQSLVNLGIAGTQGALSATTLCALVDEAQQDGRNLGGPSEATDLVLVAGDIGMLLASPTGKSLENVGVAATQVHVAGTICVFTAAAGNLLTFFDLADMKLVGTGLPATAIQIGPDEELIAFRVPENGLDLNNDGDGGDEVMHAVAVDAVRAAAVNGVVPVTNLGLQAIACTLHGCEAFPFGAVLPGGVVSFLGTEAGETRDPDDCLPTNKSVCDFNGDVDGLDTVVHYVKTVTNGSQVNVTSVGSLALSTTGEQTTSPFPMAGPNGTSISIQLTECEAAKLVCAETRAKLSNPIGPPLTDCEARFDVDDDGALGCTTLRNFIGEDSDGDGVIDLFDNALDTPNEEQEDTDGDGVGDIVDEVASVPPCEQSCDLNEDGSIDRLDVDAVLAAFAAGGQAQGGALSEQCGDRRDRDADRRITFVDVSRCKADCDRPDCSPPPASVPFSAPGASGPACGMGIELTVLLPLLVAMRRRRSAASSVEKGS